MRSLSALNEKIGLLRLVGRLDEALDVANEAIRQARFTGNREDLLAARIRHAQVLQFQGKLDAALTELSTCLDEAQSHGWAELEACAAQHRGNVHFDQQDYAAALVDFKAAASLRERHAPNDQLESSLIAVAVVESFLDEQSNAPH